MTRKPIKVEVMQEGDKRFLLKIYDDGREQRTPIVKIPKKRRNASRSYGIGNLEQDGKVLLKKTCPISMRGTGPAR